MPGSKWIQRATSKMADKGTKGSFRKIASRMGDSTEEAADKIMDNKDDYSSSTKKKANFVRSLNR